MFDTKQIVDEVSQLPRGGLTNAMRNICILEMRVDELMKPIEEARTNQWGDFYEGVREILEPIYQRKQELGDDFGPAVMIAYETALTNSIRELQASGTYVKLGPKGGILEPKKLGQYDSNLRRVLKNDTDGVLFSRDEDGELKYTGKSAIEKLGSSLASMKEKAEAEATRQRLKDKGVLSEITDAKKPSDQATAPAVSPTETTKTETTPKISGDQLPDNVSDLLVEIEELMIQLTRLSTVVGKDKKVIHGSDTAAQMLTAFKEKVVGTLAGTFGQKVTAALQQAANS